MTIAFSCPHCGHALRARDKSAAEKVGRCKNCGQRVTVPRQSERTSPAAAPPAPPSDADEPVAMPEARAGAASDLPPQRSEGDSISGFLAGLAKVTQGQPANGPARAKANQSEKPAWRRLQANRPVILTASAVACLLLVGVVWWFLRDSASGPVPRELTDSLYGHWQPLDDNGEPVTLHDGESYEIVDRDGQVVYRHESRSNPPTSDGPKAGGNETTHPEQGSQEDTVAPSSSTVLDETAAALREDAAASEQQDASDEEPQRGMVVTFKNDTQIFAGSWVMWIKGTQGLSFYHPRNSAGVRMELILDAKSRSGTEEILDLPLRDISRVAVEQSGQEEDTFMGTIHLLDGRVLSGTLRGKHFEGTTIIDGLEATQQFMLNDVSEVVIQRQEGDDLRVDGTVRHRDGRQVRISDLRFQLLRTPPFLRYAGNTGIDLQVDAGTSVRITMEDMRRVDFISKYESGGKAGMNVRVYRKGEKSLAAPTFDGLQVTGQYLSGNLKGVDTKLRFDNVDLILLHSIERKD